MLKADDSAVFLVDSATQTFYNIKNSQNNVQQRYPLSTGIVGEVARKRVPVRYSRDAHKQANFHPEVDQRPGQVTCSLLCCPIVGEDLQVRAVVSVRDESNKGGFEQEEEDLLKILCSHAAVVMQTTAAMNTMVSVCV